MTVEHHGRSTIQWRDGETKPVPFGTKQPETRQPCFLCLNSGYMVDGVFNGEKYEVGPDHDMPCRAGCMP